MLIMRNRYADYYNKNGLVPMDDDPEKEQETEKDYIKSDKIEDYKGRNQAFYKILNHYTKLYKEKYNGDHEALLRVRSSKSYKLFWQSQEMEAIPMSPLSFYFKNVAFTFSAPHMTETALVCEGSTWIYIYPPNNSRTDILCLCLKLAANF